MSKDIGVTWAWSQRKGIVHWLVLAGVILLGAALRFHALGTESLWGDEITKATWARQSLGWIYRDRLPYIEAPLTFYLLHFVRLVGEAEFILRFPAALFGTLTIAAIYRLGRRLFGPQTGLLAATLLALSPVHIFHSQQLDPYALFALLTLLSLDCFVAVVRRPSRRAWLGWVGFTSLSFYNHFFTLFVLAASAGAVGVLALTRRLWSRRLALGPFLAGGLLIVLLWLPEVLPAVTNVRDRATAHGEPGALVSGSLSQALADIGSLAVALAQWFAGSVPSELLILGLLPVGLVAAWCGRRREALVLCLLILVLPLPTGIFRGTADVFNPRYFIFALPILLILVAHGATAVAQGAGRAVTLSPRLSARYPVQALVFLLIVALWGLLAWPTIQHNYRTVWQDWRGVGDYLEARVQPGDRIIQLWWLQPYSLSWYLPPLPDVMVIKTHELNTVPLNLKPGNQVWWIVAHQGRVSELRAGVGDAFDVAIFDWLAVLHLKDGVADEQQALGATLALLEVQGALSPPDEARYEAWVADLRRAGGLGLARSFLEQGDAQAAASEWAAAARSYEMAAQAWPGWGMAHTRLGNAYRAQGQLDLAETEYRRSLEVEPGYVGAYLNLGDIYERQGRRDEAFTLYQRAVEIAPDSAWAQATLGSAYLRRGDAPAALAYLERAVELEPDNIDWLLILADAYRSLEHRDDALAAYRRILALDPDNQRASEALREMEP